MQLTFQSVTINEELHFGSSLIRKKFLSNWDLNVKIFQCIFGQTVTYIKLVRMQCRYSKWCRGTTTL